MKKLVLSLCVVFLIPALVRGQDVQSRNSGQAYAFVAPGAATTFSCRSCTWGTLHIGGGGEATFYKGLGIGAELGYLSPMESMSSGVGLASVNGIYIFRRKGTAKLEPFVTAGGSVGVAAGGAFGAINLGGGVHYWMRNRVGLRIEFRDHIPTASYSSHLFEGRVGFAFR